MFFLYLFATWKVSSDHSICKRPASWSLSQIFWTGYYRPWMDGYNKAGWSCIQWKGNCNWAVGVWDWGLISQLLMRSTGDSAECENPYHGGPDLLNCQLVNQQVPYLTPWNSDTVIHAMVTSRVDCCNLLYEGLPLNMIHKLQLVVWMLTALSVQIYIQPLLHQLPWLSIGYRIQFKIMVSTIKAICSQGPTCFWNNLFPYLAYRALFSMDQHWLVIPSLK